MIVYVYSDMFFTKINLPLKVSGVYPVYINEKNFLGNIEEKDGKWVFSISETVDYFDDKVPEISEYTTFVVRDRLTKFIYHFYVTSTYSESLKCYSMRGDKLLIGPGENNDIVNTNSEIEKTDDLITITFENGKMRLETNSYFVFVNDKRVSKTELLAGDYIFYYGLKLIIIGKEVVINNPASFIRVNQNNLNILQLFSEEINEYDAKVDEDVPLFSKQDYYFKAPRFYSKMQEEEVKIDEPPNKEEDQDTPLILTIGPQFTMMCTSGISLFSTIDSYVNGNAETKRFVISLVTALLTMISALLWPTLTRVIQKKMRRRKEEKRQKRYTEYLAKKNQEIQLIKNRQKQVLIDSSPSLENCKLIVETRPRTLWQKNIEHDDFLELRLGIGSVKSKINITYPEEKFTIEDEDMLRTSLRSIVNESLMINDVPLTVNMVSNNKVGVIGDIKYSKRFMDSLFLQIMTFHSYTELKIIVYTKNKSDWEYLKVLPHTWNNSKTIRYFATNLEEFNNVVGEIEKSFDARREQDETIANEEDGEKTEDNEVYKNYKPYYLIFTDDINSVRNVGIVKKILSYKKNLGFTLVMLHDRLSTLPSETTTFINVEEKDSCLITNDITEDNQVKFIAEFCDNIDVYECAQKLANIPIMVEKEKYELPASLSFLEMYGVGKVEQLNILERWENNNPVNSLSVPIGIDQSGEIFKMDIHEKFHGPHGLVAGTTGSGKSEWIVTYILSLALNFSPDEVQFVLIDFKGGGLALSFENSELGIKLPHLAGTITNLDKSEVCRAISSMESELQRRQSIFNEARERLKEGSMNIYKYQQFYRKKLVSEPMSHLLIICDEFAELKQKQPEFMESLISISRIGRSLGIHLILATQKPSGVVNDQIWSNSKFKVCLKVQDRSESQEVLKKPDAAFLKQTGSFYLEVGNDDYYNLGQSAWAGAKYYPSEFLKKKVDQSVQTIDNIGRVVNSYDLYENDAIVESKGEQLINIVQYIDALSKKETFVKRQLWLKNIDPIQYLHVLVKKYNHKFSPYTYNIAIGEYDEPRKQEQSLLEIPLDKGNVAIIGQPGSGKESLISTIMWSSMIEHTPKEINYYVIDFGAETLKKFSKFPHVGEVLFQSEMDKVVELFDLIMEEFENRKTLFQDYNGSFDYYNKNNDDKLPLIVWIFNSYDVFTEKLPKAVEMLESLFRDAPRYGIIIVCSVSSTSSLRSRQLQYFNRIIMMQLADETSYRSVTNCRKDLIPGKVFGRGICKIGESDDSYCEFQTALIAPDDKAYEYIKETANKLVDYYKIKAKQLTKIPDTVGSEDLAKYIEDLSNVPIGYNFYEKDIARYNFASEKIHLISSKNIKADIHFIYGLVSILSKVKNVKVRLVDMLGIFKKPILDIKMFNDNLDVVFAALERDALNRTEAEDMGVNIIIGIGQYKRKLSKDGQEIFTNLFNHVVGAKKNTYIFIDDYDTLRMMKLEPWYSIVDTTKGIWLGPEVDNQSLISMSEVSLADKKYDFEGLAYIVNDTNYTLIKTLLDGDD